ncbi:MAG: hypothetical protein ABR599_10690, partial [Gemmatimonadota bacterium]
PLADPAPRADVRRWLPPGGLPFDGAGLLDVQREALGGDCLVCGLLREGSSSRRGAECWPAG